MTILNLKHILVISNFTYLMCFHQIKQSVVASAWRGRQCAMKDDELWGAVKSVSNEDDNNRNQTRKTDRSGSSVANDQLVEHVCFATVGSRCPMGTEQVR